jgi:general secretion pathway protein F
MMRFEAKALQPTGNVVRIGFEALDAADAAAQARAQGYRILTLTAPRAWPLSRAPGAPRLPLVLFCQELLALLEAGLALVEALETLCEKEARPEVARVLTQTVARLREGHPLSFSLEHSGARLPPPFVASVRASEKTGALPETLARFVEYQSQMDSVKRHIAGASIYPAILVGVGLLVTLFLMLYVVPRFSQVYADLGTALPLSSRLLMGWGQFLGAHALALALGACGVLAALATVLMRAPARRALMGWVWRVPALGARLRLFYLSRLYRSMGMLLRGGMPIGAALDMAAGVLPAALRAQLALAAARIREGQAISHSMAAQALATPVALRMLRVGERSGRMGEMMERIASFYEDDTARWVERFTKLFEPLLMLAIGLLIGCIVVLMYMPIFDLAGSLQ